MDIYITLDYELFSGEKSGTPQRCIIDPMNQLEIIADRYNIKYTIFVDACYLHRLYVLKARYKQVNLDFELVVNNIKNLVSKGHVVQMHYHPQWEYCVWNDLSSEWLMDTTHFKLSDMDCNLAKQSFRNSKNLLDEIVGYKTNCFRACGYCLETYLDYIQLFKDNNIKIDSSVARGLFIDSPVHKYDYREVPSEMIYSFENNIKVKSQDGCFREVSISSYKINPINYCVRRIYNKFVYSKGYVYGDGKALPDRVEPNAKKISNVFSHRLLLASIDGYNSNYLNYYYTSAKRKGDSELILSGHPKNATGGSLENLIAFLSNTVSGNSFKTIELV